MAIVVLLLASVAVFAAGGGVAEEQETVSGAIPGKKFCVSYDLENGWVGQILLSQQPSSHETESYTIPGDSYDISHIEQCYDLWYDASGESSDLYSFFMSLNNDVGLSSVSLQLATDIDFGGVNADSSACFASFAPLPISGASFFGGGHTIKNLCYMTSNTNATVGEISVGLFSTASDVIFYNVSLENVYIRVDNSSASTAVYVGALVGKVDASQSGSSFKNINLKNVKVVASVAGGLVGYLDNVSPMISNVVGENVEVAAEPGVVATSVSTQDYSDYKAKGLSIRLGGLVGKATNGVTIQNAAITGLDVHSELDTVAISPVSGSSSQPLYETLGGLAGSVNDDGNGSEINNTYTVGKISGVCAGTSSNCNVGFLAGELHTRREHTVGSNYHYGESDVMAKNAAGLLYIAGNQGGETDVTDSWMLSEEFYEHVFYGGKNYRNVIAGVMEPTEQGLYNVYGGFLDGDYMKSDAFAESLNSEIRYYGEYTKWSRKDGVNEGLPVFATESLKPIHYVTFAADHDFYRNASETERNWWRAAGGTLNDSLSPPMEVRILTDYTGKLSNSSWQAHAAELSEGGYFWSVDGKTFKFTESSAFPTTDITLQLESDFTVPVVYGFYFDGEMTRFDDLYPDYRAQLHFMGEPLQEVSRSDTWALAPYLGTASEEGTGVYKSFMTPHFYRQECTEGEDDDGYPVTECEYFLVAYDSPTLFFAEALRELGAGSTLFVLYDELEDSDLAGGYLFVADLHGRVESAKAQVMGIADGELSLFASPDSLSISSSTSMATLVRDAKESKTLMPYSPWLVANYSSMWASANNMVALVAAGGAPSSSTSMVPDTSADGFVDYVLNMISSMIETESAPQYLKDTVDALESPSDIMTEMYDNYDTGNSVTYARFVRVGKDGIVHLENLIAAAEELRIREASFYERKYFPIFVGFLPSMVDVIYHVSFDLNSSDQYYIDDEWMKLGTLADKTITKRNAGDSFFEETHVYGTYGCFTGGWLPEGSYYDPYDVEGDTLIYSLSDLSQWDFSTPFYTDNSDHSRSLTLYGAWVYDSEFCEHNNRGIEVQSDKGSVHLRQIWKNMGVADTIDHYYSDYYDSNDPNGEEGYGLLVPWSDYNFTFSVEVDPYVGYELDGLTFQYMDWHTQADAPSEEPVVVTKTLKKGDKITITPNMIEGMLLTATYDFKTYNIVFEPDRDSVVFDRGASREGKYKLRSLEDSIPLPVWVYTADQCVVGWTVGEDALWEELPAPDPVPEDTMDLDPWDDGWSEDEDWSDWRDVLTFKKFNFMVAEMLESANFGRNVETYALYGFWVGAQTCIQEYGFKQVKLSAKNGTIQFKELLKDSGGKVTGSQIHYFAEDGTMLVPSGTMGDNYVVVAVPEEGYILDSLVMTVDGQKTTYHGGDTLSGPIYNASFVAYFVEDNKTPVKFVKQELLQSGNAVQLTLETSEFRAGGATLRITLENDDGKIVVDTLLAPAITQTPYTGVWEYYPLAVGSYLVTAKLARGKDTALFMQDFTVEAKIAAAGKEGWRMLSLANVNMDSVSWARNDAKFFWWDETRPFGTVWQYREFRKGSKVDPLVGYWYSSLSGRSLVTSKKAPALKEPVVWKLDSLYSGWNLVGNPYGWYVDLYGENVNEKGSATEKSNVEFWSWNSDLGEYEEVSVVGPYEAVWAKVSGPSSWKLPSKPEFVSSVDENGEAMMKGSLKKSMEVGAMGKNRWAIRAVLSDVKGKRDGWNILGVSEKDWNAEEPPAGMGDRVNLSIKDGKKSLAKSFKKAAGDSYEWTVSLDASGDRTGYLRFEGVRALNAEGLKVFVTIDGSTTQMNEGDSLKVALGSMAKTATVRVAPSARVTVASRLDGLRALHTGSGLQVSFDVSESLAGERVRVELLDTKGKVMSSASGKAVSGTNSMQLETPKSGLYMVRVRVGSKQAVVNVLVK